MAFTGEVGEVLHVVLSIVEEASHSLGQHLMVVGDEAILGATDTFAAEQGVGGEAVEDLKNDILYEARQCIPLARGLLHFIEPTIISVQQDESFLTNEVTKILFGSIHMCSGGLKWILI